MRESYQIRVHVIEARNLKSANEGKGFACNPLGRVTLKAGEGTQAILKNQYTSTVKNANSAFWDEVRIFQEMLTREQFTTGKIEVAVEDANLFNNELVGAAQFDLASVYDYPSHEIFGQWSALIEETKGGSVQGFIRLSITVRRCRDRSSISGSGGGCGGSSSGCSSGGGGGSSSSD